MNGSLTQRVGAAAVAAWWTILIAVIWAAVAWLACLAILHYQPDWLFTLWGGRVSWEEVHALIIRFWAAFKLILWTCVMVAVWLSLWSRQLKRAGASG